MRLTKSKVDRWLRHYSKFAFACCRWCPLGVLVLTGGLLFSARDSLAARITTGLIGTGVGLLFVAMGVYFTLVGLSLFFHRVKITRFGALSGLGAGLILGGFSTYLGVAVFIMLLR